jgi:hypothetical protein
MTRNTGDSTHETSSLPTASDAKRARTRLVSGSVTLRLEFVPAKWRTKPRMIAFTDRYQPGLLAAAFKPRGGRVPADLGRLGDCYVVARRLGER